MMMSMTLLVKFMGTGSKRFAASTKTQPHSEAISNKQFITNISLGTLLLVLGCVSLRTSNTRGLGRDMQGNLAADF